MVANRLKNLVKLTREAVRDARQVVEELVNQVTPRPQPSLVRVPVRSPSRQNPFNSSSRRQFSTSRSIRSGTSFANASFKFTGFIKNVRTTSQTVNLANKMWPYSAFRRPLAGRGSFPNGLYKHFVNTNARNFSTYGGNFSREAVQNLTTFSRCFLKNSGDGLLNMNLKSNQTSDQLIFPTQQQEQNQFDTYDEVFQTLKLARAESSDVQRCGCYVEFELPNSELPIPSLSFIDSEIVESIEKTFKEMKEQIDRVHSNIQLIFDTYGSLPIERSSRSIKIHFPNLESWEVENLLVDIGIAEGIVHSNEDLNSAANGYDYLGSTSSSSSMSSRVSSLTSSTTDLLATYLNEVAPDLISSASESSVDSESLNGYYPVLSNSEEIQTPSLPASVVDVSHVEIEHSVFLGVSV